MGVSCDFTGGAGEENFAEIRLAVSCGLLFQPDFWEFYGELFARKSHSTFMEADLAKMSISLPRFY